MMKLFFLEESFNCHKSKSFTKHFDILNSLDLPRLTNKQKYFFEIELDKNELLNALESMPNNKSKKYID